MQLNLKDSIQTLQYNLDNHNLGSVKRILEYMLWRTDTEIDNNFEIELTEKFEQEMRA